MDLTFDDELAFVAFMGEMYRKSGGKYSSSPRTKYSYFYYKVYKEVKEAYFELFKDNVPSSTESS